MRVFSKKLIKKIKLLKIIKKINKNTPKILFLIYFWAFFNVKK